MVRLLEAVGGNTQGEGQRKEGAGVRVLTTTGERTSAGRAEAAWGAPEDLGQCREKSLALDRVIDEVCVAIPDPLGPHRLAFRCLLPLRPSRLHLPRQGFFLCGGHRLALCWRRSSDGCFRRLARLDQCPPLLRCGNHGSPTSGAQLALAWSGSHRG
jgi:hypothetical protein